MSKIAIDNMILTKDAPTTAGSKMLEGYMSLFNAEVLERLYKEGYEVAEKTKVGEFAIDLLGETANECDKGLKSLKDAVSDNFATLGLDVNGYIRRVAAQNDKVSIKPTYGTVSRYGTIPVACSGETVSVIAENSANCEEILGVISGHDDKDGTSLSEAECTSWKNDKKSPKKIAVLKAFLDGVDEKVREKITAYIELLKANGVEVIEIDDEIIKKSKIAWNILMCAELCNNVSRYDGVKYGYRSNDFTNIDEMYTNTRTEAFGPLLKTAIIFGSETLSTDNYFKVYDKALRVRRVIKETFDKIFEDFDAVLLPACSKIEYCESDLADKNASFEENLYTAPASITGLPAVVAGGVQFIGKAFSESVLFEIVKIYEKGRA